MKLERIAVTPVVVECHYSEGLGSRECSVRSFATRRISDENAGLQAKSRL